VRIAAWNVNSVRARLPRLLAWLGTAAPDVVLLQETKVVDALFPREPLEDLGYNIVLRGEPQRNGVAILAKIPIEDVATALPGDDGDAEARYVEGFVRGVRVASVYVPNGTSVGSDRFAYKLDFLRRLRDHARRLLEFEEPLVIGGDYNVAPTPLDVYDPEGLDGTVCYHPDERARLRAILNLGLYDAFRVRYPAARRFTWWPYQGRAHQLDQGMRIDHLLLSPQAADRLEGCGIDDAARAGSAASDHAPVHCTLAD
jgi:exodeoxyribonuclease III